MKKAIPIIIIIVLVVVAAVVVIKVVNRPEPDTRGKIALIPETATGDFWESLRRGAEQAVEGADFRICCEEPTGQSPEQIVQNFIADGVSGIVLASREARTLLPSVEKVCDANIPCVVIGSYVDSQRLLCCIDGNNYIAGLIAARRMAEILNAKGKVVVVKYVPGSTWTADRINGFTDTIENDFPEIQILDTKYAMDTVETAKAAAEGLLNKNPEIDGLFACNESASIGALKALQSTGRNGKVKMVGFGTESSLVEGLKAGIVDSLVAQDPNRMGIEAVNALIAALEGRKVDRLMKAELTLLTKDNVESAKIQALLGATARP